MALHHQEGVNSAEPPAALFLEVGMLGTYCKEVRERFTEGVYAKFISKPQHIKNELLASGVR